MTEYDSVKIKDQLGRPENSGVTVKRFKDDIIIEESPLAIYTVAIGTSFILGSSTRAILGTSMLGAGAGRTEVVQRVTNQDNIYRERFTTTLFEDTDNTTADWADTQGKLAIASAEVAQSKPFQYGTQTVNWATINITTESGSVSTFAIELTSDGGSNWNSATNGTQLIFDASKRGTDARFKITNNGALQTVTYVNIEYN